MICKYPIVLAFGCAFGILLGLGAGNAIILKGIVSAEAAAWVAAIASYGAVVAAVWVATDQRRQRAEENMVAAEIAAAGMIHRVALVQAELSVCIQWFGEVAQVDGAHSGFKVFRDRMEALPEWTQDELIRLAPLPRHCGLRLAAALDRIVGGKAVCKIANDDPDTPRDPSRRKRYAGAAAEQLLSAQKEFAYALQELKEATNGIVR